MTTKPDDIVDVLDTLIRSARSPGCNQWLCQIDGELARAKAEIERGRRLADLVLQHADMWTNQAVVRAAELHAARKGTA